MRIKFFITLDKCLAEIPGNNGRMPKMNYDNYERNIVETYRVELKNFPGGVVTQPASLTRPQLQALLTALESTNPYSACHWVVLSDSALRDRIACNRKRQERGEQVYIPRKKQQKKSLFKSSETVTADPEDGDDEEEDEE